jgi:hypothetical protein
MQNTITTSEPTMPTTMPITLTLHNETRTVEAYSSASGIGPVVTVYGIELVTSCGSKKHIGSLTFRAKAPGAAYTLADVWSIDYHGCRGNGSNTAKSRFRYIGWCKEAK